MKALSILFLFFCIIGFSQKTDTTTTKLDKSKFLKEVANNACKCIDSVETYNKIKDSVATQIHNCIDKQVVVYQMGVKLSDVAELEKTIKEGTDKKKVNITINASSNSEDYKHYYYEIERYLMNNCPSIKAKIAANDVIKPRSLSNNSDAIKYYNLGLDEYKNENYEKAIENFKKAVQYDSNFAFAYDNLGICNRKLNKFDDAIAAYEKSLKIDPNGLMPLQNIAIAFEYKKEYKKAIKAYENLAKIDAKNPEVYYGIGQIYAQDLLDYEKGLSNLCKAYNLYLEQKSPYRSDAEKLINIVYVEMKKQGNEAKFNAILRENNIKSN